MFNRATLNIKLAQQRSLEKVVKASKAAGETTEYADKVRQLNKVKAEVSSILDARES